MQNSRVVCLDKGFVELVQWTSGSSNPDEVESHIVKAARTSTTQDIKKQVKTIKEDRALIRYLYRNRHTSPFEMINFTFNVKAPIFVIRQIQRHRTGKFNEYSGRYSEFPDEFYDPLLITPETCPGGGIRLQDFSQLGNKQGSSNSEGDISEDIREKFKEINSHLSKIFGIYHELIRLGVAKEVARYGLPVGTYSQMYFNMDLHNLLKFLSLRMEGHAQPEIQVYARAMFDLIKPLVPTVVECFQVFTEDAIVLSSLEIKALREKNPDLIPTAREKKEFVEKLKLISNE